MKFAFYNGSDGVYKLIASISKKTGGAAKLQWTLAENLIAHGHEVIFITPTNRPNTLQSVINGIRFIPSPCTTINTTIWTILSSEKPNWFYWHTNSMHLGPCFYIAKRLGIAPIYACASDKDCIPRKALHPFSYRKHFWFLYRWGLDQAYRILVQHSGQRQLLGPRYAAKTRLVNNIAVITEIAKKAGRSPYIAWVANLRAEKRPHLLVEIAKALPQHRFVVCGSVQNHRSKPGYAQVVSQNLIALPNVDFRGAVSPDEVLSIIANASVFLSTSEQEGFPNTMLEAWSVGIPVVSLELDLGGTITHHDLGRVTRDITETVSIIKQLMGTPTELTRLGDNGKHYVLENHSPSVVYHQLTDALDL